MFLSNYPCHCQEILTKVTQLLEIFGRIATRILVEKCFISPTIEVVTRTCLLDFYRDEVTVRITKAIAPGEFAQFQGFKFFGPASPFLSADTDELPVQFTRPYFDCGRSNKWIVSATSPIFDRLPRYPYDPDVPGNVSAGIFDSIRKNRSV